MQHFSPQVPVLKPSLYSFDDLPALDQMDLVFGITSIPQGMECLLAFLEVFHDPHHMIGRKGRGWWPYGVLIRLRWHRSFPFFATARRCSPALLYLRGGSPERSSGSWRTRLLPLSSHQW